MKIAMLGNFSDSQTGLYVLNSFRELGHQTSGTDIRRMYEDRGPEECQTITLSEMKKLNFYPDIILILKGIELKLETIKTIKSMYPKAKLVNWFFDKYLGIKPIWETKEYFDTIREFDFYLCSLKGVSDKLNELGFSNVKFLDEACYPESNGECYANSFQIKKYGSDVAFIGTIGFTLQHPKRIGYLTRVAKEGFNLKIYGNVICQPNMCQSLIELYSNEEAINAKHSIICTSSLINLGIDQDESIESGYSARLFRVLCAGGFYLTNYTKNLENYFKINLKDESILDTQELVVYYSEDDLIKKLDYLLERPELIKKIANNGQKTVYEKHKFTDRCNELIKITEELK